MERLNLTSWIAAIVAVLLIIPYFLLFVTGVEKQAGLFEEDGLFENASALSFLVSSLIFLLLFFKISKPGIKFSRLKIGHYVLLIFSFLFFLFAGEEISWGQRIFNIETPELLKEINVQREINLHNIRIFDVTDTDGLHPKHGLARMITANRMFSLFWFFFCVVIPVLNRSNRLFTGWIKKTAFPVVPLWISVLFLLNFAVSKAIQEIGFFQDLYVKMTSEDLMAGFLFRLTETKEFGYAFLFMVSSIEL